LFGFDSYATLSAIKFGFWSSLGNQPVANLFFVLLPDSLLLFKFLMFLSIFASIVPIWLLVRKFYCERTAWITTFLLLSLSPIILFGFGEFENEILAYPFIVWSIYFLLNKHYLKSVTFMCLALLFWKWVYYLTFFNFGGVEVVEMQMFSGLMNLWLLLPFILFIVLIKNRFVAFLGLISVGLWLFNAKLFIFLLPFVSLAIPLGLDLLKKRETLRNSLYILAFCSLIGFNIAFFLQQPTDNDLLFVSNSLKIAKDGNLEFFNDPSLGYWIMAQGFETKYNPGSWKKFDLNKPGIYLTNRDLNCQRIAGQERIIGRKETKIFQCT
jgi:hypothetical protein